MSVVVKGSCGGCGGVFMVVGEADRGAATAPNSSLLILIMDHSIYQSSQGLGGFGEAALVW